jgi:hypothetical protein
VKEANWMPEMLLPRELETADSLLETLEKLDDALHSNAHAVGRIIERMKGTTLVFEDEWRRIVAHVAKGQTAEMQADRAGLLYEFEKRLDFLKRTRPQLSGLHKRNQTDIPDPDFLLPEIAGMERLKARVFDSWQSAEDLEDLAARDYPLTTADLDQIGTQRRPPDSWYAEESKPF